MIILDSLLIGGLRFVLDKLAAVVEAEMDDDAHLREELLAAQMRLELGEIDEAEFARVEADLLAAIVEVRRRRADEPSEPGALRVTGAEITFEGGEEAASPSEPERAGGRKARGRRRR